MVQNRHVTHRMPGVTLWSKTVTRLTGCQERPSGPKPSRDSQAAKSDPMVQNCHVTHRLPGKTLWSKTVT